MAEYTNAALQTVPAGQNVLFSDTAVPCTRGWVIHREGSGVFTLRGITNQCFARYRVQFGANIAVPTGGTAGPISVAIAIAGEPLAASTAIITPAAVDEFGNVSVLATIDVPRGCCVTIAVENVSDPAQAINVRNANLEITRVA